VPQDVNGKVVDLVTLYNFYKGRMTFFSTNCAQIACQVGRFMGAVVTLGVDQDFFTHFHSKSQMPLNMKVVSLDKIHNFYIGRN
jgi:hypothetical protein